MPEFITPNTRMPPYMVFPRFLLSMEMSETAKLVYIVLLDRARLSQADSKWSDEHGHVFLLFPIHSLAESMGKSEMTIKTALATLEKQGLIERKRIGFSQPNRIYVKIHSDRKLSVSQTENYPSDGKSTVPLTDRNLSPIKNKGTICNEQYQGSKAPSAVYGSYKNVFLTAADIHQLRKEISRPEYYIERLSSYMMSTGKRYQNHAATIRSWAARDQAKTPARIYECKEGESL